MPDVSTEYVSLPFRNKLRELVGGERDLDVTLSFHAIKKGYVVPFPMLRSNWDGASGGVLDSDSQYIVSSAVHEPEEGVELVSTITADMELIPLRDETVIFVGSMLDIWGHALTDNLKKLWFLFSPDGERMIRDGARLVYLSRNGKEMPAFFADLLALLGLSFGSFERIDRICRFTTVIVPDNSLINSPAGRLAHLFYKDIVWRLIQSAKELGESDNCHDIGCSIYLSRNKLGKNSKDFNEKEIESFFRYLGYTVVYPEHHSVVWQINTLRNAGRVVATDGSIAHSLMFCNPKSSLMILLKNDYVNGYQICINNVFGLNVSYVSAHHSILANRQRPWSGPFFLYVSPELKASFDNVSFKVNYLRRIQAFLFYCLLGNIVFLRLQKYCQKARTLIHG